MNRYLSIATLALAAFANPLFGQSSYLPKITGMVVETRVAPDGILGLTALVAQLRQGQIEFRVHAVLDPAFERNLIQLTHFVVPRGAPFPTPAIPDERSPTVLAKYVVKVDGIHFNRYARAHGVTLTGPVVWGADGVMGNPSLGAILSLAFGVSYGGAKPSRVSASFAGVASVISDDLEGNVIITLPEFVTAPTPQ